MDEWLNSDSDGKWGKSDSDGNSEMVSENVEGQRSGITLTSQESRLIRLLHSVVTRLFSLTPAF